MYALDKEESKYTLNRLYSSDRSTLDLEMCSCKSDLHLASLDGFNDHNEQESDSSCDSDVEVISEVGDIENHVINFNAYCNTNSNDDDKYDIQNDATESYDKKRSPSPDASDNQLKFFNEYRIEGHL